jgi:hypothetical protein
LEHPIPADDLSYYTGDMNDFTPKTWVPNNCNEIGLRKIQKRAADFIATALRDARIRAKDN